ncbi:hypothetical protein DFP73DRAFT_47761 [Morchella snyderi]|nr:hypothetical protein DFP73DRAFT_47761 [Morchella snyderi]
MSGTNQSRGENPSQLSGHLQYVKGAASEMIGNTLDSASWKDSGRQDKEAAIGQMRAAKQQDDNEMDYSARKASSLSTEGKLQNAAGGFMGCGGMQERGSDKEKVAEQKTTEGW